MKETIYDSLALLHSDSVKTRENPFTGFSASSVDGSCESIAELWKWIIKLFI